MNTAAPSAIPSFTRAALFVALALLQVACGNLGDRRAPIPTALAAGSDSASPEVLVIVLPGRRDNVEVMQQKGVDAAIHEAWPHADVMLTSATLAYYRDGGLAERLHRQIVLPARERGYREIWMVGASMGGLGTLLYEQAYPEQLQGLVLLAPYLGGRGLLREIADNGGLPGWDAGPEPATRDRSNFDRELWRFLQGWLDRPSIAQRVWVAYGDRDRLRRGIDLLQPALVPTQVLRRPGGHSWEVWNTASTEIFGRASTKRAGL